jgi:hypothetical protein
MLTQRNCLGLGMNVNNQTEVQEYLQCFKETPTLDTDYNFSGGFFEFTSSTHHVISNVDKSGYNVSPESKLEPETNLGQVTSPRAWARASRNEALQNTVDNAGTEARTRLGRTCYLNSFPDL